MDTINRIKKGNTHMNIEEKVIEIIRNNTNAKELTLSEYKDINMNQLGINSLNFIKIIVDLEETFDIEFDDDKINYELMNNIEQLIELILKMTSSKD